MSSLKVSTCVWILILLFMSQTLQGWQMNSYDLDSLVFKSTDVVEAKVREPKPFGKHQVLNVEVTAVYKGDFTKGQTVPVADLVLYFKPDTPISSGDDVFLFLEKVPSKPFYMEIPPGSEIYGTEPSGVKLVQSGHVISFFQYSNPGPYSTGGWDLMQPEKWPAIESFRDSLTKAVQNTDVLAKKFQGEVLPSDSSWLMESIRTRQLRNTVAHSPFFETLDLIAKLDCQRLAKIHDNEGLAEALALDLRLDSISPLIFVRGFATRNGLDFLLQATSDEQRPLEARRRYAVMLAPAAAEFRPTDLPKEWLQWAGDFTTSVANLALKEHNHFELCKTLIESTGALLSTGTTYAQMRQELNSTSPYSVVFWRPERKFRNLWNGSDFSGAFAALKKLHEVTHSELLKYEIEFAIAAADSNQYQELQSQCGPIVSVARLQEHAERLPKPPGRSLLVSGQWRVRYDIPVDTITLIARHKATGKQYKVIRSHVARWMDDTHREDVLTIPDHAPKGVYRIFYQFWNGDTVISTSHYLETKL